MAIIEGASESVELHPSAKNPLNLWNSLGPYRELPLYDLGIVFVSLKGIDPFLESGGNAGTVRDSVCTEKDQGQRPYRDCFKEKNSTGYRLIR